MARVLLSTFGSGGDVFPLIPIADDLRARGHEVLFATSRSLGLYLRAVGLATFSLGDATELAVRSDRAMFSTRFFGWSSHRRVLTRYVAPTMPDDLKRVSRLIDSWNPDVVVTMTYATAARVAAFAAGVPHLSCTIYPQYFDVARRVPTSFARSYVAAVRELTPTSVLASHSIESIAWGVSSDCLVLHDPALLPPDAIGSGAEAVGYPYWDALPDRGNQAASALDWLAGDATTPAIAVTLGSFVGLAGDTIGAASIAAARAAGLRTLVVNGRLPSTDDSGGDTLAVGFVALSRLLPKVVGLVHHGGLGTTFAALRLGVPSIVIPQAFDQPYVAAMVERTGAGTSASTSTIGRALPRLLESKMIGAAAAVRDDLIPTPDAVSRVCHAIVDASSPS